MRTAFVMEPPARTPRMAADPSVTVAISEGAAVRGSIESLVHRAGARLVGDKSRFDVLLLALDSSTPLPASAVGLGLLAPATAHVCVIWRGAVPGRNVISQLLRAGVAGILPAGIESSKFQAALQAIRAGLQVIDPSFLRDKEFERLHPSTEELTEREQEVLSMMGEGLSNKEISSRLSISTHTVKFHISSILGKLGAASRTEAVSIGVKSGRLTI